MRCRSSAILPLNSIGFQYVCAPPCVAAGSRWLLSPLSLRGDENFGAAGVSPAPASLRRTWGLVCTYAEEWPPKSAE